MRRNITLLILIILEVQSAFSADSSARAPSVTTTWMNLSYQTVVKLETPVDTRNNYDERLQVISQSLPSFPPKFLNAGINSMFKVSFKIDSEGKPVDIVLLECSEKQFIEIATRAVRDWRFVPQKWHGKSTSITVIVTVKYLIVEED